MKVKHVDSMIIHIPFVNNPQSLSYNQLGCLRLGNGIDVLNFDQSLHVIFKHLLEEVLQLTTSEELQDFFPLWRVFELAKIWLHVSRKDSQGC